MGEPLDRAGELRASFELLRDAMERGVRYRLGDDGEMVILELSGADLSALSREKRLILGELEQLGKGRVDSPISFMGRRDEVGEKRESRARRSSK